MDPAEARRPGCPLLWAALAFAAGIACARFYWRGPLLWMGAMAVVAIAAGFWARPRARLALVASFVGAALAGGFAFVARSSPPAQR
jgi:hypothetical protein